MLTLDSTTVVTLVEGIDNILVKVDNADVSTLPAPVALENSDITNCLILGHIDYQKQAKDIAAYPTHSQFISEIKTWNVEHGLTSQESFLESRGMIHGLFGLFDRRTNDYEQKEGEVWKTDGSANSNRYKVVETMRLVRSFPAKKTTTSPILAKVKPYSFTRPKITLTMEEFEKSEDNDFEPDKIPCSSKSFLRVQPKRGCIQKHKILYDQVETENSGNESSDDTFDESELVKHIDNAVDKALNDHDGNSYTSSNDDYQNSLADILDPEQIDTSDSQTENSSDESINDHTFNNGIESYDNESITDEQYLKMNSEETDHPKSSSYTTLPRDEKKEFSCRCGSVFRCQSDLDDHIMNSSYCYDFYMYHDKD